MTIKIITPPDVYLTPEEHACLFREWEASQTMTAIPVDFETFVRQRKCARYVWPQSGDPT